MLPTPTPDQINEELITQYWKQYELHRSNKPTSTYLTMSKQMTFTEKKELYTSQLKDIESFITFYRTTLFSLLSKSPQKDASLYCQIRLNEWIAKKKPIAFKLKLLLSHKTPRYKEYDKEAIKANVKCGDIIHLTPVIEQTYRNRYRCPFHKEQTASLFWFKKTNRCYCFGCNWSGDVIALYMKLNDTSFHETLKALSYN